MITDHDHDALMIYKVIPVQKSHFICKRFLQLKLNVKWISNFILRFSGYIIIYMKVLDIGVAENKVTATGVDVRD